MRISGVIFYIIIWVNIIFLLPGDYIMELLLVITYTYLRYIIFYSLFLAVSLSPSLLSRSVLSHSDIEFNKFASVTRSPVTQNNVSLSYYYYYYYHYISMCQLVLHDDIFSLYIWVFEKYLLSKFYIVTY